MKLKFIFNRWNEENGGISVGFLDTIMNSFLAILVLFMAWVVISTVKKEIESRGAVRSIITVHITWPKGDEDIDTWGLGPDRQAVGYSKPQSDMLVLLRDDTGRDKTTPINEEFVVTVADKEHIKGRYIFNLFYFRGEKELTVEAKVMIQKFKNGVMTDIQTVFERKIVMEKWGVEKTIVQFDMDENGEFVKESVNQNFQRIALVQGH